MYRSIYEMKKDELLRCNIVKKLIGKANWSSMPLSSNFAMIGKWLAKTTSMKKNGQDNHQDVSPASWGLTLQSIGHGFDVWFRGRLD